MEDEHTGLASWVVVVHILCLPYSFIYKLIVLNKRKEKKRKIMSKYITKFYFCKCVAFFFWLSYRRMNWACFKSSLKLKFKKNTIEIRKKNLNLQIFLHVLIIWNRQKAKLRIKNWKNEKKNERKKLKNKKDRQTKRKTGQK
jgi:hypothetical protein